MNIIIEEIVLNPLIQIEETITEVFIEVSEMQVPGERGVQGEQGLTGLQGIQGVQGPQGPKGDTGANGVVDYTNIVQNIVKEATQGANITGTVSETILYSKLIPANTFKNGDFMTLFSRVARHSPTASSLGVEHRIKINTSNTLTGALLIAKNSFTAGAFGNQVGTLERTFNVSNGVLIGFTSSFYANTDIQNSNGSPQFNLFNPTIDNYIFITGQLFFSGDTMYHLGTKITN